MKKYKILNSRSHFLKNDLESIKRLFNLAVDRQLAFPRPIDWISENINDGKGIALKTVSTEKLMSIIFLIPSGKQTATAQVALWRSPEYAYYCWLEMVIIAAKSYKHVYLAVYKNNQQVQDTILMQDNVVKVVANLLPVAVLNDLLYNSEKHDLFMWSNPACLISERKAGHPYLLA